MSSASRPVRTYSRRQSMKNASGVALTTSGASGSLSTTQDIDEDMDERPKKRRTLLKSPAHVEDQEGPTTPKRKAPTRTLSGSRESSRESKLLYRIMLVSSCIVTLLGSPEIPTAPSSPVPESISEEVYGSLTCIRCSLIVYHRIILVLARARQKLRMGIFLTFQPIQLHYQI